MSVITFQGEKLQTTGIGLNLKGQTIVGNKTPQFVNAATAEAAYTGAGIAIADGLSYYDTTRKALAQRVAGAWNYGLSITEDGPISVTDNWDGTVTIGLAAADSENAGSMSASDFNKLGGIEAQATNARFDYETVTATRAIAAGDAQKVIVLDTSSAALTLSSTAGAIPIEVGKELVVQVSGANPATIETGGVSQNLADGDVYRFVAYDDGGTTKLTVVSKWVKADSDKLANIEENADVTDAANVDGAGAVMESDFLAGTFLFATNAGSPAPKTASETRGILNVEDGATADQDADEVPYDNSQSALTATNVQAALDEIEERMDNAEVVGASGVLPSVQDLTELKALNTTNAAEYKDRVMVLVEDVGLFRLDRDSAVADNGTTQIEPTTGTGVWFKLTPSISNHNNMSSMQGGTSGEYYHLTAAELASVQAIEEVFTADEKQALADAPLAIHDTVTADGSTTEFTLDITDIGGNADGNVFSCANVDGFPTIFGEKVDNNTLKFTFGSGGQPANGAVVTMNAFKAVKELVVVETTYAQSNPSSPVYLEDWGTVSEAIWNRATNPTLYAKFFLGDSTSDIIFYPTATDRTNDTYANAIFRLRYPGGIEYGQSVPYNWQVFSGDGTTLLVGAGDGVTPKTLNALPEYTTTTFDITAS